MYKNLLSYNTSYFTFDIVLHPRCRFKFWWRDWYIARDRKIKQRLWKIQIGLFMFTYWYKRR